MRKIILIAVLLSVSIVLYLVYEFKLVNDCIPVFIGLFGVFGLKLLTLLVDGTLTILLNSFINDSPNKLHELLEIK